MKLTPVLVINVSKGFRIYETRRFLPLLHHLQRGTQDRAAKIGLLVPETTSEAVQP